MADERRGAFRAAPLFPVVQRLHHHPGEAPTGASAAPPYVPGGPRERRDARDAEPARRQEARHGERRGQRGGHDHRAEEHEERRGQREPRQGRSQREPRGAQQRGAERDEERGRGHGGRARAPGTERGLQVQALHAAQRLVSQPVGLRRRQLLVVVAAAVRPRRCRGHGEPRGVAWSTGTMRRRPLIYLDAWISEVRCVGWVHGEAPDTYMAWCHPSVFRARLLSWGVTADDLVGLLLLTRAYTNYVYRCHRDLPLRMLLIFLVEKDSQ